MNSDYYIEINNWIKATASKYDQEIMKLEEEKKNSKTDNDRQRQIKEEIKSKKQELLRKLKGNATTSSEILASGLIDNVTIWWANDYPRKQDVQDIYMLIAASLEEEAFPLPGLTNYHWPPNWMPTWFCIDVSFTLKSPWHSKDDRPFHVLDNPVRKDRVFGVPFMSAASWKGLLRWACRMQAGLSDHLEKHDMKMDGWKDPSWIVHLFGNEKSEQKDFLSGALVFYPTWFNKLGFEVINPHSRKTRAGTKPIYYEVVPAGTKGKLQLLYAPLPGEIENDKVKPADFFDSLIDSIKALLETYGISAKRTAGWGTAKIDENGWRLHPDNGSNIKTADDVVREIKGRFTPQGGDL
jgi:CRISPR-associated protein Cmr2